MSDTTRRDALARLICARLCVESRTESDLRRIDSTLTLIERGHLELPIRVYVAGASTESIRAVAAVEQAKSAGFVVTSTWLDVIAATPGGANPTDASEHQRRAWSATDLGEIERADVLWFLVPGTGTTRGAWVELGFAYAPGKTIVCSGTTTTQSIFCALGEEFVTDREALDHIREVAKVRERLVALRDADADLTVALEPRRRLKRRTITVPPKAKAELTFDVSDLPDAEVAK